MAAEPLHIRSY